MIPLLDTAIGFAAIMLMLSLMVKSVASLIKNYFDYYSSHLRSEVDQLLQGVLGSGIEALSKASPWLAGINWKGLGEEYLSVDKMGLLLSKLDPAWQDDGDLKARIELHLANLKYGFNKRMKNLAFATGLGLCLLLNINALTIWKTVYTDGQVRSSFAGEYSKNAMKLADELAKAEAEAAEKPGTVKQTAGDQAGAEMTKEELSKQAAALRENVGKFLADVDFGVGRVWRQVGDKPSEGLSPGQVAYEFFGSLLTGILIGIGAPYWHDLLRTLSNLRRPS